MKLHGDITINGKLYPAGSDISAWKIYPFFLFHMGIFGSSGFFLAYADTEVPTLFLYAHGGFALLIYLMFYNILFGRDEVRWMFINAALGGFGIYAELRWILALQDLNIADFPPTVHVIPFMYYIMYTFLLRQMALDLTGSRENPQRRRLAERGYIVVSILVYVVIFWVGRGR